MMPWRLLTSGFALKLWFFLAVRYQVGVELGLDATTAIVMTLVVLVGLILLRLPMQLAGLFGPRVALLVGPALVWAGLAWWAVPGALRPPGLGAGGGSVLAPAGAASRYAAARYREAFAEAVRAGKGLLVPLVGIVAGFADGPLAVLPRRPASDQSPRRARRRRFSR